MALAVMGGRKSQHLPSANWRPRQAGGVVLVQVGRTKNQENWWCKIKSKPEGLRTNGVVHHSVRAEDWCLCSGSQAEPCSPFLWLFFLFRPLTGAHPHWGWQPALLSVPFQMLSSSGNTSTDTPEIIILLYIYF